MSPKLVVSCIVAVVIGVTAAPTLLFGASATAPPPTHFSRELAALAREQISAEHASRALDVQDKIAQAGLVSKVEATLGRAYAGVWFEPATAQLRVGVTSPASRRKVARTAAQAGLGASVTEMYVRSTWPELLAAQGLLNHELAQLLAHEEAETAVIPQRNAVSIAVSSSVSSSERAAVKREASRAGVRTLFVLVPGSQLRLARTINTTECNDFQTNKAFCDKPITPGVTITSAIGGRCTAGPLTTSKATKAETYLLTAGHCIDETGGTGVSWFALNRSGARAEIGKAAESVDNTKGDVGAILVNRPGEWGLSGTTPVFAVTAQWNLPGELRSYRVNGLQLPVIGFLDCKQGQTGGETCGTITKIGTIGGVEGVVEDTGAEVRPGDSGGPWIAQSITKSGIYLEGTTIGLIESTRKPVWEPLDTAFLLLKGLDLELLTLSNESGR